MSVSVGLGVGIGMEFKLREEPERPFRSSGFARGLHVDASASGAPEGVEELRQPRPWEGLALWLHQMLNCGKREEESPFAEFLKRFERVLRGVFYPIGPGIALYLAAFNRLFHHQLDPKDWYVLLVLGVLWFDLLLLLMLSLWGRFLDKQKFAQTTTDLKWFRVTLPELFFNFKAFGAQELRGTLAAILVAGVQLGYVFGWGIVAYEATVRALVEDSPYENVWIYVWFALLFQLTVTALARAVAFRELKREQSLDASPPTGVEKARLLLANLYIFVTLTLLLPFGISLLAYLNVSN